MIRVMLTQSLAALDELTGEELTDARYRRFRRMGDGQLTQDG
jgi:acetyl-CoA carboxylase alpha subunit